MKLRILSYGISANHASFTNLTTMWSSLAISDFDAFLYDPKEFIREARAMGVTGSTFSNVDDREGIWSSRLWQHVSEVRDLLNKKGGVMAIILRSNEFKLNTLGNSSNGTAQSFSPYFLIDGSDKNLSTAIKYIRSTTGTSIKIDTTKAQPAYITGLRSNLKFEASLHADYVKDWATILASDSIGACVAISFQFGKGTVFLLPVPENVDGQKLGALLAETVRSKLTNPEPEKPSWAESVVVPGSEAYSGKIALLEEEKKNIIAV